MADWASAPTTRCGLHRPGARRRSPRARRRRTSRERPGRARTRQASATTASASTAATSLRSTSASAGSPVSRLTERSGLISVGQRLHRRTHDDLLAVRDAAFDPAGAIRLPVVAPARRERSRRALPSPARLEREAVSDLDAFDGLDPHHRRGEPGIQPLLRRRIRPETGRHASSAPRRPRRPCRGLRVSRALHVDIPILRTAALGADSICESNALATAPAATVTAVWRALARSNASRVSSSPNFSAPRGRRARAAAASRPSCPCPARPRAARGSSPSPSSRGPGWRRGTRAETRACDRAEGRRAPRPVALQLLPGASPVALLATMPGSH